VLNSFFDTTTLMLKYVEMQIEGQNYIYESNSGLIQKKFTDQDFDPYRSCPSKSLNKAEKALKENLSFGFFTSLG
jgi:hypothetical protein